LGHEGPFFHVGPRRSRGRYGKKRTQVPQKSAKVDILPISIYLVVVLYRHKHCRPQKVELDLACRDSTTTNIFNGMSFPAQDSKNILKVCSALLFRKERLFRNIIFVVTRHYYFVANIISNRVTRYNKNLLSYICGICQQFLALLDDGNSRTKFGFWFDEIFCTA
jgi:hypothetical protein